MKNYLKYKGYIAEYTLDENINELSGYVINSSEGISFHSETANGLIAAFHDMVDAYLEMCKEMGLQAAKPYNGVITLRIPSELHKTISEECLKNDKSINKFVEEAIIEKMNGARNTPQFTQVYLYKNNETIENNIVFNPLFTDSVTTPSLN